MVESQIIRLINSIPSGRLVEVSTELGGVYPCHEISYQEREGGARSTIIPAPKMVLSGRFIKVLKRESDPKYGPFVDSYLQLEIYGERAVYWQFGDSFKLTGWEHGSKILSIPFRNISSVVIKN